MHRFAPVALATILAATAPALLCAQAPTPFTVPQPASPAQAHFTDPANLAGERVRPRDGRELPIDGGIGADGKSDNALGLAQMLRKLSTRASLMLIVAHPDDEDGGMLTYYSRGLGARVAILTLNRGEGGQNQMTGDFEDALGLLRTQELLSADRYLGVDTQMFGTEVDFGFTKTKAEAFQKWNHQRVLYDAVRAVRIFRPLVIASVFMGAVTDGHGQHQVSGQIAQEVFKAAGDPNVFPELTKEGILPWQPLKVYARVPFSRVTPQGLYDYATGQTVPAEFTNYVTGQKFTTAPTPDVTINEGATDPLLSTCAANPADLPASLRATAASASLPSSSSRPSFLLSSFREAGGSASPFTTRCQPLSYVQFARIGLGLQRSQIGNGMRVPSPGRSDVSYHLYGSHLCPGSKTKSLNITAADSCDSEKYVSLEDDTFFNGIDTTIWGLTSFTVPHQPILEKALASLGPLFAAIHQADNGDTELARPEKLTPLLAETLKQVNFLIETIRASKTFNEIESANLLHELRIKRVQLNDALALELGLHLDATTPSEYVPVQSATSVSFNLSKSSPIELGYPGFDVENADHLHVAPTIAGTGQHAIHPNYPIDLVMPVSSWFTKRVTRPYFLRSNIEDPVYKLSDPELRNAPQSPPALVASASVWYEGVLVTVARVVHSGPQPVQIIPSVSLTLTTHAQVVPNADKSFVVGMKEKPINNQATAISLGAPGWKAFPLAQSASNGNTNWRVEAPDGSRAPTTLKASLKLADGQTYTEGFRPVGYGTLPRTNFYTPATLRVVPADLKLPPPDKRRIAYLPGTGDDVPAALASIGLTPTILKVSDLTASNLAKYDTVILGVRTYNAHPDLHGAPTQALLDFARNGGNVVVQYQTPEFTAADAPYPLTTHNERVIDETAPVTLLTTANSKLKTDSQTESAEALLTTPNKITSADFNGWIEERGHGFLDTWDPHYTALTEVHDPGAPAEHIQPQAPQRGGLVTVQLGKGRWTYVAFALYRQLPEAVPGAFRLFVNLLNP